MQFLIGLLFVGGAVWGLVKKFNRAPLPGDTQQAAMVEGVVLTLMGVFGFILMAGS